jgi:hypothetical protein
MKEEVVKRVQNILDNNNTKIVATGNVVEVYINTYFGWKKEIVIGDNEVDFDGVKYEI